jgi:hypothetical protein
VQTDDDWSKPVMTYANVIVGGSKDILDIIEFIKRLKIP